MEKPEAKERNLIICGNIDQGSAEGIIKSIFEINADDDKKEEMYRDWKREPIRVFIHSYGGGIYSGLAIIDVIKQSKTPVHTICVGSCMSMALWVWITGKKRLIGENGTLMFHDVSTFSFGKTEEIKQDLDEALRLQKALISELTSKSLVKEDTLNDYITRRAEWYIPAKEALDLKLADGYYK